MPHWTDDLSNLPVADVHTPVMLVHGEMDFIPIQQAEEYFTALYRQDKAVTLLRYAGEWHTLTARANVLDLWNRLGAWLERTNVEMQ
ncbi:MAG: alpha/beta hydrolase family protein [Longimicrobiales bacterium]